MPDFKVGTRVRLRPDAIFPERHFLTAFQRRRVSGTIRGVFTYDYAIQWDEANSSLHHCNGLCPDKTGWYIMKQDFVLADPTAYIVDGARYVDVDDAIAAAEVLSARHNKPVAVETTYV